MKHLIQKKTVDKKQLINNQKVFSIIDNWTKGLSLIKSYYYRFRTEKSQSTVIV